MSRSLFLLGGALSVASCAQRDATQLVFRIESDPQPATWLSSVRLELRDVGSGATLYDRTLSPSQLPAERGLITDDDSDPRRIRATVFAVRSDNGETILQRANVAFFSGRTARVTLYLSKDCDAMAQARCFSQGAFVCGFRGQCEPSDRPSVELLFRDGGRVEASVSVDAAVPMDGAAESGVGDASDASNERDVVEDGAAPDAAAPLPVRLIAPLSGDTVTNVRPMLRWQLPAEATGARVELCRDRAMSMGCSTFDGTGTSLQPPSALSSGLWFWRARALMGPTLSSAASAVWPFRVGLVTRSTATNTSWRVYADFNGDGYSDVAIGAPRANGATGRVDVFNGSVAGVGSTRSWSATGGASGDEFGASVASAGDINGDGFADLIVGAPKADPPGASGAGSVSIYVGGATGLAATPFEVLSGVSAGDEFGTSVSSAGDVNGDGIDDVIVGAPFAQSDVAARSGAATIFLGGASTLASFARLSPRPAMVNDTARFGTAVGCAGDVDGDGFSDVIVGGPNINTMRMELGEASVFFGGVVAGAARFDVQGGSANAGFGRAVAGIGDVDGDGYADVLFGSPDAADGARQGQPRLFRGASNRVLIVRETPTLTGTAMGHEESFAVSSAGDINGDGVGDFVQGAPGFADSGAARVILGSRATINFDPMRMLSGAGSMARYGAAVANAGDVNGDGYADLIVAAPSAMLGAGVVLIYHGSAAWTPLVTPARTLTGAMTEGFGASVALRAGRARRRRASSLREAGSDRWCALRCATTRGAEESCR